MIRCGYVYNPIVDKWFNHTLRTAWSLDSLAAHFASEVEFEVYAVAQAKDPSFLRSVQANFKPLMDQTLNDQSSPGRLDN